MPRSKQPPLSPKVDAVVAAVATAEAMGEEGLKARRASDDARWTAFLAKLTATPPPSKESSTAGPEGPLRARGVWRSLGVKFIKTLWSAGFKMVSEYTPNKFPRTLPSSFRCRESAGEDLDIWA